MNRIALCVAFAATVCAGAVWAADAPAAKSPQEQVDAREAAMKKLGGAMKGGTDLAAKPADAHAKFAEAIKIAESIPSLFPKGTGIGDAGVTKSRALQDIWKKPDEFKTAAANLVAVLKAADAAVDVGGDAKGTAFNAIGKACKGCHDAFRGPETE